MRSAFVIALAGIIAMVCAVGGVAHAQDAGTSSTMGTLPNGGTLTFDREFLHEVDNSATKEDGIPGKGLAEALTVPQSLWFYFNYAHCVCDEPGDSYGDPNNRGPSSVYDPAPDLDPYQAGSVHGAGSAQGSYGSVCGSASQPCDFVTGKDLSGYENVMNYEIGYTEGPSGPDTIPLQFWTGDDQCATNINRAGTTATCVQITNDNLTAIDEIFTTGTITPPIHIYDLMMPEQTSRNPSNLSPPQYAQCLQRVFTANEWLIASSTDDPSGPDYFQNQTIATDSQPPPGPGNLTAEPAENAIQLNWTTPIGNTADLYVYQALCLTDDDTPAHSTPTDSPYYMTPRTLCGVTNRDTPFAQTTGSGAVVGLLDAGVDGPDAAVDSSIDAGVQLDAGPVVIGDAGPINVGVPERIAEQDPALICGTNTNATATSMRIENLANGTHYRVALLVIDRFGNTTGIYVPDPNNQLIPRPVTNIWEDLHDRGSHVEGGFCLIAETYGDDSWPTQAMRGFRDDNLAHSAIGRALIDAYYGSLGKLGVYVHGSIALRVVAMVVLAPLVAVALLWHVLTLPGLLVVIAGFWLLKRNRRRVLAGRAAQLATGAGAAIAMMAAPKVASAQPVPNWDGSDEDSPQPQPSTPDTDITGSNQQPEVRPYQEEDTREALPSNNEIDESLAEPEGPPKPNWMVGLRIGPYTPQIDAQLGTRPGVPGPYAQMFGTGLELLPALDVERVVWRNDYGTIGAGVTLGYLSRTANAFLKNSSPEDPNRPRSAGDTNSFKLLPLAALASYRFTYLADAVGVPIVPYVRGGLSYYVWWMNAPDGDIATVCENGGTEPNCMQNRAAGASLGFQVAVGISVYAEQIDKTAAQAMRDSGLQHAGFYAELSYADVDGFGGATKLSVGDATYFGGVMFDF